MKLHHANIRRRMARIELNQVGLARKIGWSEAKMSRVLRPGKKAGVTFVDVEELARGLGVKEGEIVELEDVAQTEEERRVLRALREAKHGTTEQDRP